LYAGTRASFQWVIDAFVDRLRQLGWMEGENLVIEWRFADGQSERMTELVADLVSKPVEIIVAVGNRGVVPTWQQTSTIPIVMLGGVDAGAGGPVQSLGHPGGNVTGNTFNVVTTCIKSVELFKNALPALSRLAIVEDTTKADNTSQLAAATQTAQTLGIQVRDLDVQELADVDQAFEIAREWSFDGLLVLTNGDFVPRVYARLAALAAQNHVPAMYESPSPVTDSDGLMAFVPDYAALWRQGAEYVDKILRGATPADLPVQEPQQFDFVVNVKAAQALGTTFPPDVAAQVTQWVQ
jgi:putative ABC transport system substrate-binding protein